MSRWREGKRESWHASLQSTTTQHVHRFATIEALWAFLDGQLTKGDDKTNKPMTHNEHRRNHA